MQPLIHIKRILILIFLQCNVYVHAEISFVSWNIRDFGQSRVDMEITTKAKVIQHSNIITIQEVVAKHLDGAQAVARLVDQLHRMRAKWDYRISDPTQNTSPQKSETYAYLWKTTKITIPSCGPRLLSELFGDVERKPYFIQFKIQNKLLTVLNYHACTHSDDFPERAEILSIPKWLKNNKYDNVIWAGDMNLQIDDAAFHPILQYGYKNVLNVEKTSLKKSCKNGENLNSAEDNIFYRLNDYKVIGYNVFDFVYGGDCADVDWKWISYSDHLGVEMIFRI